MVQHQGHVPLDSMYRWTHAERRNKKGDGSRRPPPLLLTHLRQAPPRAAGFPPRCIRRGLRRGASVLYRPFHPSSSEELYYSSS